MIKYNELLYVSEDLSVREKLLKCHHDNLLTRHFDADKISELLLWICIKRIIWVYSN